MEDTKNQSRRKAARFVQVAVVEEVAVSTCQFDGAGALAIFILVVADFKKLAILGNFIISKCYQLFLLRILYTYLHYLR